MSRLLDNKVPEKGLLSFGQLLVLKREQRKLTLCDAIKQSGVSMLFYYEKDKRTPRKRQIDRLIDFYKISNEELESIKKPISSKTIPKVSSILPLIESLICDVSNMKDKGFLASELKDGALHKLELCRDTLTDCLILDSLI